MRIYVSTNDWKKSSKSTLHFENKNINIDQGLAVDRQGITAETSILGGLKNFSWAENSSPVRVAMTQAANSRDGNEPLLWHNQFWTINNPVIPVQTETAIFKSYKISFKKYLYTHQINLNTFEKNLKNILQHFQDQEQSASTTTKNQDHGRWNRWQLQIGTH